MFEKYFPQVSGSCHHLGEYIYIYWVRKYFGNYLFFILGINFFLWFQLEVETFQVGVGCLCRGGRPKKKSWWGVGGEGAAPPPQMHSQNMLCDLPSVRMIFGALGSQFFVWGFRFI